MRKIVAMALTAALLTSGCASAGGPRLAYAGQAAGVERSSMADYVQRLPAGSKVRVERVDGSSIRGTLMKASADSVVVQANTRLPEPPLEVPLSQIARLTVDTGGGTSTAKAIGIGIASGVGVFLGILAIFAASWDD